MSNPKPTDPLVKHTARFAITVNVDLSKLANMPVLNHSINAALAELIMGALAGGQKSASMLKAALAIPASDDFTPSLSIDVL